MTDAMSDERLRQIRGVNGLRTFGDPDSRKVVRELLAEIDHLRDLKRHNDALHTQAADMLAEVRQERDQLRAENAEYRRKRCSLLAEITNAQENLTSLFTDDEKDEYPPIEEVAARAAKRISELEAENAEGERKRKQESELYVHAIETIKSLRAEVVRLEYESEQAVLGLLLTMRADDAKDKGLQEVVAMSNTAMDALRAENAELREDRKALNLLRMGIDEATMNGGEGDDE